MKQHSLRVLVCGSRDFSNTTLLYNILDNCHKTNNISTIIEGDARGADRIAGYWAKKNQVDLELFPAYWDIHGKSAGPIRNALMLKEGHPDVVFAFPTKNSKGTWDMVNKAREAEVEVMIFEE